MAYGRYNKYNNTKVRIDGILFDSKAEGERYLELKSRLQAKEIENLRLQVSYELIPVQREPDVIGPRGGVTPGKVIHRPITYVADFVYYEDGEEIVEDCKGVRTEVYKIKRKLFYYKYKKDIVETSDKRKQEREKRKIKREQMKAEALSQWEQRGGTP